MYYLLNKDRPVAEFDIHKDILGDMYKLNIIYQDSMPIGFDNIQKWIDNRKGSKHNAHLKKIMAMCGCDTTEGFIAVTHSATINDTFWIKSDKESISWRDVSLYTNDFDQVVSRLAFEGVGLYCIELSSTLLRFYDQMGSEEDFRRMIVLDGLTFNVDRHAGNYGVLVNNDTLEPIKMAPVFDFNLSMLPYVLEDEFDDIGTKLLEYGPRIGDDFVRTAHAMLTPAIRADLISLKGFQFSFEGDDKFSKNRVKKMEELINRQIEGILEDNILYTRDIFIPHMIVNESAPRAQVVDEEQEDKISKAVKAIEHIRGVGVNYTECDENGNLILHIPLCDIHDVEILYHAVQESLVIEKEGNIISDVAGRAEYSYIEDIYKAVWKAIIG